MFLLDLGLALKKSRMVVAIVASIVASACSQTCPEPPICAECSALKPQNVTLSNLDAQSRERLKQEVMDEIHDEMRAQWLRDWQREMADSKNCPDANNADDKSNDEAGNAQNIVQSQQRPGAPNNLTQRKPRPSIKLPPTQPIEKDDRGLKIMRHVFTTNVSRRLPVDERDMFTIEDAGVFCFVEVSSNNDEERMITLKFTHSTGLTQSYDLPVGQSPSWRTWSKLNLTQSMTGAWLCEIFNEDGVLLASKSFTVE